VHDWNEDAQSLAAAEERCGTASSYEALLDTPGAEAVVISTGAKFHAEQIQLAAERGLHVFVEKPVCATSEEMRKLLELRTRCDVVIGVGHTAHNMSAGSLKIRDLIESGELGTIASFQKTTAHTGGLSIKPGDWRGDPEKNPGGMLFQCGVHGLHELMYYFGPVAEVFATMRYDVHSTKTADVAVCNLRFESGLIGTLCAYHVTAYKHSLHIFGTNANLYREERYFDEGVSMTLQRPCLNGSKEVLERLDIPEDESGESLGNLRNFYQAIRFKEPMYPDLLDGLRAVEVVFAAEKSSKQGGPVRMGTLSMAGRSDDSAVPELVSF